MGSTNTECAVCCEAFNRGRRQCVRCHYCEFEACSSCVQTFLLSVPEVARCMSPDCRRRFGRQFLFGALSAAFLKGPYKRHLEALLFDRERALLPATQLELEVERAQAQLLAQRQALQVDAALDGMTALIGRAANDARLALVLGRQRTPAEVMAMTDEDAVNASWAETQARTQGHAGRGRAGGEALPSKSAPFVRKCPETGCQGFLSQTISKTKAGGDCGDNGADKGKTVVWRCGMCAARVCPECHEMIERGTPVTTPCDNATEAQSQASCASSSLSSSASASASASSSASASASSSSHTTRPQPHENREQDQEQEQEPDDRDHGHRCRPEDLATARLLAKDSKPCPRCASMIFRVSGCPQMWCTVCNSAFDWTTGRQLDDGVAVHNPHYFDWIRTQQAQGQPGQQQQHQPRCNGGAHGDVGAVLRNMDMRRVFNMGGLPEADELIAAYRLLLHVHYEEVLRRYAVRPGIRGDNNHNNHNNNDLRRAFLLGEIDEAKFRTLLQRREKSQLRKAELLQVFQTFEQVAADMLAQATQDRGPRTPRELKECLEGLREIRDFTNRALRDVAACYGTIAPRITDGWDMTTDPAAGSSRSRGGSGGSNKESSKAK